MQKIKNNRAREFHIKKTLDKIRQWAKDGRLAKHTCLSDILSLWKEWGDEKEVKEFIASGTGDSRT